MFPNKMKKKTPHKAIYFYAYTFSLFQNFKQFQPRKVIHVIKSTYIQRHAVEHKLECQCSGIQDTNM